MTASIKEALRIARGYVADDVKRKPSGYDPSSDLRVIDDAVASLSCGEARERIARIIDPNAGWGVKLDSDYLDLRQEQAKMEDEQRVALRKADAILATGCVPDEASIRADEREKQIERDAKVALIQAKQGATAEQIAAAIRAGRGEG